MAQDPHSDGYFTQWFFFSTRNLKRGQKVTFKLVNFTKKDSLANYGMRPCVYSLKKEADSGEGWHRSETGEARYYRNFEEVRSSTYCLENGKPVEDEEAKEFTIGDTGLFSMKFKNLYTMEFQYTYEYDNDTVFFAPCQPYTARDLDSTLQRIEKKNNFYRRDLLCKTLGGNPCWMITMTDRINTYLTPGMELSMFSEYSRSGKLEEKKLKTLVKEGKASAKGSMQPPEESITPMTEICAKVLGTKEKIKAYE